MSLSESFDPGDPALIDRFPNYPPETDIGHRPPTPTREISSWERHHTANTNNNMQIKKA
jgi:hypothetical protein